MIRINLYMNDEIHNIKTPTRRRYFERWFSRGVRNDDLKYFVTLTFVDDVNKEVARRTVTEFLKRLNKQSFGRKYKKDSHFNLKHISVSEQNASQTTTHYHLLISDPSEVSNRVQAINFKSTIFKIWKSLKLTGKNHLDKNDTWFQEISDSDGIAGYLTKSEQYAGADFFDVQNTNVPYR